MTARRLLILALALGLAACGSSSPTTRATSTAASAPPEVNPAGDIPDNQAYVAYSPPGSGFSVKVPEGWARTTAGSVTSFTDKLNRIEMERVAGASPPSAAQARRTLIPALARSLAGFKLGSISTVRRSAGPALRITYLARSPADPVTGKSRTDAVERYSFAGGVVLTLSGPQGADNVDPWRIVSDSVRLHGR